MQNIISNSTRTLLGLKPIQASWEILQKNTYTYFYENNLLHKVIYTDKEKDSKLLIELDTNISLDDSLNLVSARGKTKPLNLRNIEKEKSKEPYLSINLTKNTLLVECGVKWLPELSFASANTINNDIPEQIKHLSGESEWNKKVQTLLKNPKIRQSYKDGDIFCVRLDAHQYVYALLIGSFLKLRKKDFWPVRNGGNYLSSVPCVPIMLRKFNFVSNRNDLHLEEILKHELLNPEIIMDDLLLRGDFKIVAHKKLTENDILMPMHYSCYGKHKGSGWATALGMGVFDKENKYNKRAWIKTRMPFYKEIKIVFNWGLGSVEIDASLFVDNEMADEDFVERNGIGGIISGLDKDGKLINSDTIFSDEKLRSIFKTMNIDSELDFDAFNKKYGGLTRKEYLERIK